MESATKTEEVPSFQRVAYACTLMAQAVIMGIIKPMTDGRLQARLDELNRSFDVVYSNRPCTMQAVRKFQDAHDALLVAYTEREEPYDWRTCCENWTYREQRWAIDPRFFDATTDVGWSRMRTMTAYIDEALPGQRNFDLDRLLELPPENLKRFDWQRFPVDEDDESDTAAPPAPDDPNGSIMAVEDDPKWRKAQALVDERLASTIMEYELASKPLPEGL